MMAGVVSHVFALRRVARRSGVGSEASTLDNAWDDQVAASVISAAYQQVLHQRPGAEVRPEPLTTIMEGSPMSL